MSSPPTRVVLDGCLDERCERAAGLREALLQTLRRAVERAVALRLLFGVEGPLRAVLALCRRAVAVLLATLHPALSWRPPRRVLTALKLGAPQTQQALGFGWVQS